ncbi:MAG: PAS domain-containing protein, partial [Flavobacteriales bacterium]
MSDWRKNILRHPSDALALVESDSYIIRDVNDHFLRRTQKSRQDVIGKPCDLICLKSVSRENWSDLISAVNHHGYTRFSIDDHLEVVIQKCDEQTWLVRYDWNEEGMRTHFNEINERLRILTDVAEEGVLFIRGDVIIDANHQFARSLGYSENTDVIGRHILDFFSKSDLNRILANAKISSSNKHEAKSTHTDGRILFFEISASENVLEGKETLVVVLTDITAKKRTEQSLQQSVLSFQRLIENAANGVVILFEGKIQYANRAACELFGVDDEDDLYDKRIADFVVTDSKSKWIEHRQAAEEGLETEYTEIQISDTQGSRLDVGVKSVLTVYDNKPSVQVTLNNVTARNQLAQEQLRIKIVEEINAALKIEIEEHRETQRKLQRQQSETAEQKAKLEAIYNSTENLMVCTIDREFRITAQN